MNNKTIASLAIAIFAVCGSAFAKDMNVEPEQNAVLQVWESYGIEQKFIKIAAEEFEKKYAKYNVKVNYSETESVKTVDKMSLAVQGNKGADVYILPHDRLGQAINAGVIMPNLVSADRIKKDFMSAAVQASTGPDGKIYGFPLSIETYGLIYNTDIFKKAPATFEEVMKVGKTITNRGDNRYGIFWDIANFYFAYSFLAMDGGYVFGNNGYDIKDIGLNNKGAVKGLEALISLKPISLERPPGKSQADAPMTGLFGEGKIGAIITGPWSIDNIKKSKVNFGIAPLPTYEGKHPISFSGVRLFAVNPASKYKKAAQLFAKFCTSDEILLKRYEITAQIPPVKTLLKNKKITDNPFVKPFLEQAEYAVPMPSVPEMNLTWDPMMDAVIDAWTNKKTAKQALDHAVKVIKEQIELQSTK